MVHEFVLRDVGVGGRGVREAGVREVGFVGGAAEAGVKGGLEVGGELGFVDVVFSEVGDRGAGWGEGAASGLVGGMACSAGG